MDVQRYKLPHDKKYVTAFVGRMGMSKIYLDTTNASNCPLYRVASKFTVERVDLNMHMLALLRAGV